MAFEQLRVRIEKAPVEEQGRLWREAALMWAEAMKEWLNQTLGGAGAKRARYRVDAGGQVVVVSALPEEVGQRWPRMGEWGLAHAEAFLGPLTGAPPWPAVVLWVHQAGVMNRYLEAVGGQQRLFPAGAFVRTTGGLPHVVVLGGLEKLGLRFVLLHELIHWRLWGMKLPVWLEEGICRHVELEQLHLHGAVHPSHRDLRQNEVWQRAGVAKFFEGSSFQEEGAHESYVLAARVVGWMLAEGRERFYAFVREARREDAGEAAFAEVFGRGLREVVEGLVGMQHSTEEELGASLEEVKHAMRRERKGNEGAVG